MLKTHYTDGRYLLKLLHRFIKPVIPLALLVLTPVVAVAEMPLSKVAKSDNAGSLATQPLSWLERDTLTGDWNGGKTWLQERGIVLMPRLTLFNQGLTSGDGDHGSEFGGKADLLFNFNLSKLGLWDGLSLTMHAEYNFGENANNRGGALLPVNTALFFPGSDGADAFDMSSVYLSQRVGDNASLMFGKINMVDIAAGKPFMGGAGIDGFQNVAFVAPPSGILPPYMFGGILSIKTVPANFTFMLYDPVSAVNNSGLHKPFSEGITLRGGFDIPIVIAGLSGHQGFSATYSTQDGTDLAGLGDIFLPPSVQGSNDIKNHRYHFAYSFDQYLYQPEGSPKEGFGMFGQVGLSDGNPNPLDWNVIIGLGGTGLIPNRNQDNWGVGYYYYSLSNDLKRSVASVIALDDEKGVEIFYNATITPWLHLGADLQIIDPTISTKEKALFIGLRSVVKF
jgi:porin